MGAHSTLTIPRRAAIEKLDTLDVDDLFAKDRDWLTENGFLGNYRFRSNEELERILDYLLYETLYNFIILDDSTYEMREEEHKDDMFCSHWSSISCLDFQSSFEEEAYRLPSDEQELFEELTQKGYSKKAVMTLIKSKH